MLAPQDGDKGVILDRGEFAEALGDEVNPGQGRRV